MKQKWSVPAGTLQQRIVDQPYPRGAFKLLRRFETWRRLGLRHNFAGHSDEAGKHDGSEQTERPSTVKYLHQIFLHWAARLGDAIAFKTIRTLRTETAAAANRPRPSRTK